jgi:hypothetical protein
MAHRLDTYVLQGEISNLTRNTVHGRLEVLRSQLVKGRTIVRPAVLLLSLTGNLSGSLCGRRFRFSARPSPANSGNPLPDFFHSEQIGVVSDSLLRIVTVPPEEDNRDCCSAKPAGLSPGQQRASVYLEWHSQNGTVALELLDPILEFDAEEADTMAAAPSPPAVSSFSNTDDSCFEVISDHPAGVGEVAGEAGDVDHDDQYQLFDPGFEEQIRRSATEFADDDSDPLRSPARPRRRWDEIIPGIDPETKRLYETWDEVLGGEKDEPLTLLFDEPLCLPTPASLSDENHAWQVLSQLLKAMALRGVAFDMCHHVSAKEAYRLLIEELLPEAGVHPGLVDTGFICHFGTAEFCPHCQAEFDASP